MRAFGFARTPKRATDLGKWKTDKMPASAFELSHGHGHALGRTWTWRVCELEDDADRKWRLLIAFEPAKLQYRAWLGLVDGPNLALIARLEYHPDHHHWHCHVKTSELPHVARGVVKESSAYERVRLCKALSKFDVTENNAIGYAFRIFNVNPGTAGGLV